MIPVREFDNAFDIIAHAKACRERIRNAKRLPPSVSSTVLALPPKLAPMPTCSGRSIYAWPIGPRHERDVLYVATPKRGPVITAQEIFAEVSERHGLKISAIKGPSRNAYLVKARQECFYRLRTEKGMSYPAMARMMGDRDHTTALYGVRRHAKRLAAGEVTL